MRFNDRELVKVGEGPASLEGILHHMKPQGNDWSDFYQQPSFKERSFKLISNLLFYYRVNDTEPLGVLVLENAQISYERPHKGIPFAFSITFKVNDKLRDNEGKHIFSCRCEDDVNKWVYALKVASYEHWRTQYIILKTKISMKTGQDPVLNYLRNKLDVVGDNQEESKSVGAKKSTFHSHVEKNSFYTTQTVETTIVKSSNNPWDNPCNKPRDNPCKPKDSVPVENLIDL